MNKGDLITKVAASSQLTKDQAKEAVTAVFDTLAGALKEGDKVTLIGFGTFSVNRREERQGHNPKTRQPITIPAKNVVKFSVGKKLDEAVNA